MFYKPKQIIKIIYFSGNVEVNVNCANEFFFVSCHENTLFDVTSGSFAEHEENVFLLENILHFVFNIT